MRLLNRTPEVPAPPPEDPPPPGARPLLPDERRWIISTLARVTGSLDDRPVEVLMTPTGRIPQGDLGRPLDRSRLLALTVYPLGRRAPRRPAEGPSKPMNGLPAPSWSWSDSDGVAAETLAQLDQWFLLPGGGTWRRGDPSPSGPALTEPLPPQVARTIAREAAVIWAELRTSPWPAAVHCFDPTTGRLIGSTVAYEVAERASKLVRWHSSQHPDDVDFAGVLIDPATGEVGDVPGRAS